MANSTKMLSQEDELRYLDAYFDRGDIAARNALITAYMPMAKRAAAAFARRGHARAEDLVQEAYLGLSQAIDKFDRSRNCRLSTLAQYYIQSALMRYAMDNHCVVRVGTNLPDKKVFQNLRRLVAEIQATNGGQPITQADRREIAAKLGVKPENVARMEPRVFANDIAVAHTDSMNEEEDYTTFATSGIIAVDGDQKDVDRDMDTREIMDRIQRIARASFSERDLEIVKARLEGDMTKSKFETLRARHKISIERIRQIQRAGLRKIADGLRQEGICGVDHVTL